MSKAKPYEIGKLEVWEAYKRVKENRGAAGVDPEVSPHIFFHRTLRSEVGSRQPLPTVVFGKEILGFACCRR